MRPIDIELVFQTFPVALRKALPLLLVFLASHR